MPYANLALKFALELAALVAAGVAGSHAGGWLGAVLAPLTVIVVWGAFAAPRSPRRWPTGPRIVLEMAVFAAAFTALAWAGHPTAALTVGVLTVLNAVGLTVWHQWEE